MSEGKRKITDNYRLNGLLDEARLSLLNTILEEAESSIPPPPSKPKLTTEDIISTPFEDGLYEVIKTMPGWECQKNEDLAWIRELTQDHQNVTVALLKGCRDRNSDSPTKKGYWKSRIRNWLTIAVKIEQREKEKGSGADRKSSRKLIPRENYPEPDD